MQVFASSGKRFSFFTLQSARFRGVCRSAYVCTGFESSRNIRYSGYPLDSPTTRYSMAAEWKTTHGT